MMHFGKRERYDRTRIEKRDLMNSRLEVVAHLHAIHDSRDTHGAEVYSTTVIDWCSLVHLVSVGRRRRSVS
jgi:hypothetical protein